PLALGAAWLGAREGHCPQQVHRDREICSVRSAAPATWFGQSHWMPKARKSKTVESSDYLQLPGDQINQLLAFISRSIYSGVQPAIAPNHASQRSVSKKSVLGPVG